MPRDTAPMTTPDATLQAFPSPADYLRILSRFPRYSERGWHAPSGALPGYFGDSGHEENGLRTVCNYFLVTALVASDPGYDPALGGITQPELLARARECLRYATAGHVTGGGRCADGGRWGRHWQSSWWSAKLALGARLIWDSLDSEERQAVERVVMDEATAHLGRTVPTGLFRDTKAEENAWDAEILAAACAMFPARPERPALWEKLIEFGANTLSVPQDRFDARPLDGKPVSERVYTTNLHSDFTIENHGACHFCYVASPLASISFSYLTLARSGLEPPAAILHHVADLWARFKGTFLETRFAYIGGKDWARYTYGLYFIVPALTLLQRLHGDSDARAIEASRVRTLEAEQLENGDGSFFGKRVTHDRMFGQHAKYETDCYAMLALAYLMHRQHGAPPAPSSPDRLDANLSTLHVSTESATCFVRTPELFASFSWGTLEEPIPLALFIPKGMDSAAEWAMGNLLGRVRIPGSLRATSVRSMKAVDGGFEVRGVILYRAREGEVLEQRLEYRVLPRERTAHVRSTFIARADIAVLQRAGLTLHVANDWFNGFSRRYAAEGDSRVVSFDPTGAPAVRGGGFAGRVQHIARVYGMNEERLPFRSTWINIDDRLGVVDLSPRPAGFVLACPTYRNVGGSLHADVLSSPGPLPMPARHAKGDVLLDTHFLLVAGSVDETLAAARSGRRR